MGGGAKHQWKYFPCGSCDLSHQNSNQQEIERASSFKTEVTALPPQFLYVAPYLNWVVSVTRLMKHTQTFLKHCFDVGAYLWFERFTASKMLTETQCSPTCINQWQVMGTWPAWWVCQIHPVSHAHGREHLPTDTSHLLDDSFHKKLKVVFSRCQVL